ncbi:MAG: PAS domain-containing protein [Bacteroidota bacterium]
MTTVTSNGTAPATAEAPLSFTGDLEQLKQLSGAELDALDFGVVKVDDEGVIAFYNTYESRLADVAPEQAVGRNFFTQVAPCSNSRLFHGRFKQGVARGELDVQFIYTFTYKMRPTLVRARMYRDSAGQNWLLIKKR